MAKTKNTSNKNKVQKQNNTKVEEKNIFTRISLFFKDVKAEIKKIRWLDRKSMVKYSIAVIAFIIFFAVFFYVIDIIFALVQSMFN